MTRHEWVADRLRHKSAEQRGIPASTLLPWPRLQESERRGWLELANTAIEAWSRA